MASRPCLHEAARRPHPAPEDMAARIATLTGAELSGWCAGRVLLGLGWRQDELSALRDRARVLGIDLPLPASAEAAAAVTGCGFGVRAALAVGERGRSNARLEAQSLLHGVELMEHILALPPRERHRFERRADRADEELLEAQCIDRFSRLQIADDILDECEAFASAFGACVVEAL